jgi:hypothetical protein
VNEPRQQRRIDRMLDPAYAESFPDCSLDDLRAMHGECLEVETEVSFVRRLAQARIDILEAELDRRARGGSVGDLVAALPQILADQGPRTAPAESRLPRHLAPSMEIEWSRGLEHLISDATLVNLPTLSEEELRATLAQLRELEEEVSQRRRALHVVLDRMELALAERLTS